MFLYYSWVNHGGGETRTNKAIKTITLSLVGVYSVIRFCYLTEETVEHRLSLYQIEKIFFVSPVIIISVSFAEWLYASDANTPTSVMKKWWEGYKYRH